MYHSSLFQAENLASQGKNNIEQVTSYFLDLMYLKSTALYEHAIRVSNSSAATAVNMHLSSNDVELIRYAGLLHDIGLLCIPNQILDKHPFLSRRELSLYKKHPELGANMLESCASCQDLLPLIRFHHEKWDGSGYPKHLKKVNIPLGARIIALASYYDNVIYSSPDFENKTKAEVSRDVFSGSGILFDPDVTNVFLKVILHHK